ncbi:unnamed protein product, partial [Vitis vinifera]|uniref:Uncharacterized protein n=1 Tax=Vitis vinifera TaxID=29760 RepID=D7TI94_VITVI
MSTFQLCYTCLLTTRFSQLIFPPWVAFSNWWKVPDTYYLFMGDYLDDGDYSSYD